MVSTQLQSLGKCRLLGSPNLGQERVWGYFFLTQCPGHPASFLTPPGFPFCSLGTRPGPPGSGRQQCEPMPWTQRLVATTWHLVPSLPALGWWGARGSQPKQLLEEKLKGKACVSVSCQGVPKTQDPGRHGASLGSSHSDKSNSTEAYWRHWRKPGSWVLGGDQGSSSGSWGPAES